MSLFGIWSDFGFRSNPYSHDTLPATEEGDALLVGRDEEVGILQRKIGSEGNHPTLEGPVGVGKSSLLAVTAYRMARQCMEARSRELFIPSTRFLQARQELDEFEADVYRTVAQTLIKYADSFSHVGLEEPNVDALDAWLNSPEYGGWGGSASVAGTGGGLSRSRTPNLSEGFARSGFSETIRTELERCFPTGTGGIICVIDNLELLETVGEARATLDELRDRLFNLPQLRWVLCGSRGIVSRARSERLSGIFQSPVQLGPLDDSSAIEAIRSRIEYFGDSKSQAPVTPTGFDFIYRALNRNLREALSTSQEFSQWLYTDYIAEGKPLPPDHDRDALLQSWLAERAEKAYRDARDVQARNWQFFQELGDLGGRAGSSEHQSFGFKNQQQLVRAVTQLVQANLMVRETDPENASKTINAITPLGWLVYFHWSDYEMPPRRKNGSAES